MHMPWHWSTYCLGFRTFIHFFFVFRFRQSEEFENCLFNLTSYLESLASIICHIEEVSDAHAMALDRVPTSSGNHGKPGKSLKKKFHAWKNYGI